jgi:hypothetical protein
MENPEFRRQVWLELTPHRLVVMPLILGLLLAFIYLTAAGVQADGGTAAASAALWIFGGLLILWGTRLAGDAITEEVRGHTWDQQRMSALPPWQLAWGKLLGGPIFPWYGAALCAGVALTLGSAPLPRRAAEVALLAALAVLLHAAAVITSLLALRKGATLPARTGGLLPLLAFFIAMPVLQATLTDAAWAERLTWFGLRPTIFGAFFGSMLAFAGWAVLGVHRLLRAELQVRGTPLVWLAFLVFTMTWAAGFVPPELGAGEPVTPLTPTRLLVAYAVAHAAIYALAFAESKQAVVFRRLLWFRSHGQRERFLDELPLWLVSVPVAAAAVGALLLQPEPAVSALQKQLVVGLALLGTRDVALLLALNFGGRAQRADLAGMVYLLVLYALAPGVANTLGLDGLRGFFWPRADVGPLAALAPLAAGTLAAVTLAGLRWRALALSAPRPPANA